MIPQGDEQSNERRLTVLNEACADSFCGAVGRMTFGWNSSYSKISGDPAECAVVLAIRAASPNRTRVSPAGEEN